MVYSIHTIPVQEEPARGLLCAEGHHLGGDREPDGGGLPAHRRPHALHQHDLVLAPPDWRLHHHALSDTRTQRFCRQGILIVLYLDLGG